MDPIEGSILLSSEALFLLFDRPSPILSAACRLELSSATLKSNFLASSSGTPELFLFLSLARFLYDSEPDPADAGFSLWSASRSRKLVPVTLELFKIELIPVSDPLSLGMP